MPAMNEASNAPPAPNPNDADELLVLLDDEQDLTGERPANPASAWEVLVVDDDDDVHRATEMALRDLSIEGRPLRLIHAHSRQEAIALVEQHEVLAVILLDVVMESDDAGLQLVQDVRQRLRRESVRIILRTGQPGYAPRAHRADQACRSARPA